MSSYAVAPIFLIRAAGVSFEYLERLATRSTAAVAREVIAGRSELERARVAVEALLRNRGHGLSEEMFRAWRSALRSGSTPPTGDTPSPEFALYAQHAAGLAGAERRLVAHLEAELTAAREQLYRAAQKVLPPYLVFGGAGVQELLATFLKEENSSALPPRNARAGDRERHIFMYMQRVCAKNDTFSSFGPSAWGRIEDLTGADAFVRRAGATRATAYLERWTAQAAADALNADPAALAELGFSSGEGVQASAMTPAPFDDIVADVCASRATAARAHWLSLLEPLAALPARFVSLTETSARAELMSEARDRVAKLGSTRKSSPRFLYAATNPIGEECSRGTTLTVGQELVDAFARNAEPWIDLWRDTYAFVAGRVAAGLRRLFDTAPIEAGAIPLPLFLQHCAAQKMSLEHHGLVALAHIAFQEVKVAFREHVSRRADAAEWQLTADDCHFLRSRYDFERFDEYTFPSADLQISAASPEAIARGEYEWILSELHPPVAMLHHCFYWDCPDRSVLSDALASTVFGQPNFHFGFFAADFTSHTTVRIFDALPELTFFAAAQRGDPKWKTVPPADAEVYVDAGNGDVCLRDRRSREYLGSFARAWVIPLGFHPFSFGRAPHMPRLRCGNVIVQRRSWTVTDEETALGRYTGVSADLVIEVERLRANRDLPRYVYIRPTEQALRRSGAEGRDKDTKPVFIDLESYLSLEIFQRWLKKAGELEVTEMLPDPEHLCWQEEDGRRTFELRTLIVPRS